MYANLWLTEYNRSSSALEMLKAGFKVVTPQGRFLKKKKKITVKVLVNTAISAAAPWYLHSPLGGIQQDAPKYFYPKLERNDEYIGQSFIHENGDFCLFQQLHIIMHEFTTTLVRHVS